MESGRDVIDIGLRSTRILTRDNRVIILPNSIVGNNQVMNYSYPDPQYRIETHVGIAYGTEHAADANDCPAMFWQVYVGDHGGPVGWPG